MATGKTKKAIRQEVFRRRTEADPADIIIGSRKIAQRLFGTEEYRNAGCLFAYMDFKKEVMTGEIIKKAWSDRKRVAVPKVTGDDLVYYYIHDFSQTAPGYYGIPEPVPELSDGIAAQEDALLLIPGVAFDEKRNRIGYGRGFYDRYLAAHPEHVTAAAAFEFQVFEEVPGEEFDILPAMIITEERIIR